ncbi:MAG: pyruvate formate lyase family protein, partial [Thermodesulfobacteriota bacterium]|nr:pyruvate formate lyase family protein [Thermodesulfobacteriota bacterium]
MTNITLGDITLKDYTLENLPRLKELRSLSFSRETEICIERARFVTRYLLYHDNPVDSAEVRQAKKTRHFLHRKRPVFHDRNLLAGSTTSKALGAPLFPEFFALTLWPELDTVNDRQKNIQKLDPEDAQELNLKIFPYWMDKNVLELTRERFNDPECLSLFESLVFFIAAKAGCISHAVPAYVPMLEHGLSGLTAMAAAQEEALADAESREAKEKADFYKAVQISLQGIMDYAGHLAEEAEFLAQVTDDPKVRKECSEMAQVCRRVPAGPATTFREA